MNKNKIILDLCGGTGAWSKPYADAGYDVRVITLPNYNVSDVDFVDGGILFVTKDKTIMFIRYTDIHGILAAPPCTMFSMARTRAIKPRDLRGAMSTVKACLNIIFHCQYNGNRLKFWAMENPKARLRWFLGIPALTFNPYEFGDPHRKPTDIWGNFNTNLKRAPVELSPLQRKHTCLNLRELPPIPQNYIKDENMSSSAIARSITPTGFAKAFFNANK